MRDFNRPSSGNRFGGSRDTRRPSFGGGFGGGNRSFGRDSSTRTEMHPAVCDECGKNCQVPFKPTGNKEIFCSDCFEKRGGKEGLGGRSEERNYNRFDNNERGNDRSFPSRDRFGAGEREMFPATCDECGKPCKLPFKPSSNKPVFCSDCFEDRGEKAGLHDAPEYNRTKRVDTGEGMSGASRKELGEMRDQINSVNVKLEKIMKALNIQPTKTSEVSTPEAVTNIVADVQKVIEAVEVKKTKKVKELAVKAPVKAKAKPVKKVVAAKKVVTKKAAK